MTEDEEIGNEGDVRCPSCGWVDQPDHGKCYNCGASLECESDFEHDKR